VANCLTYARIEAENGNTLYAATGGLFKSTDGGASWTYESAVRGAVSSLAVDRKSNRKYAVAQGVGVYATFDSPPQETPVPSLALSSTACIGNTWTLKVTGAQANFPIHLFGNTDGKTWEVNDWSKTDANGVYEVTGAFDKASEGRHTLYVDVDGATSNDVSFRVSSCP
jgi:hypothetical protein